MRIVLLVFCFVIGFLPSSLYGQDSLKIGNGEIVKQAYAIVYQDSAKQRLQGKVTAHYQVDTSQLAYVQYYLNGRKSGIYKAFYPNGKLLEFGVYGNGVRHGEWTWYNDSGEILMKGKYKNGLKHGYWANLEKKCFGRYRQGKKRGKWVCYTEGEKHKVHYKKETD